MRNYAEYKLSKTDRQIMDYFWNSGKTNIMARDVLQYFYENGKRWNQQNVANYLKNLQKIGMLRAEVRNGKYYYYPTMTEEEYALLPSKGTVDAYFGGSYSSFFAALLPPDCSKKEIEKLKKILDDYSNDKYNN